MLSSTPPRKIYPMCSPNADRKGKPKNMTTSKCLIHSKTHQRAQYIPMTTLEEIGRERKATPWLI